MKKWLLFAVFGGLLGAMTAVAQQQPQPWRGPLRQHFQPPAMQHQPAVQPPCLAPAAPCAPTAQRVCPVAQKCQRMMGLFFLVCLTIHILLSVWVYQDLRRRNTGSGIWIVITLLAGLFGAAVYALVRLGDKPAGT